MKTAIIIVGMLLGGIYTSQGATNPDLLQVKIHDFYKYRPDGKAGRSIKLVYQGDKKLETFLRRETRPSL